MAEDKKHISVGFRNGQTISMELVPDEFDKLIAAIKDEKDWHTVKDDKRELALRADRVDFYGTDSKQDAKIVGFQ